MLGVELDRGHGAAVVPDGDHVSFAPPVEPALTEFAPSPGLVDRTGRPLTVWCRHRARRKDASAERNREERRANRIATGHAPAYLEREKARRVPVGTCWLRRFTGVSQRHGAMLFRFVDDSDVPISNAPTERESQCVAKLRLNVLIAANTEGEGGTRSLR